MNLINMTDTMTEVQARREACNILGEEANQLALLGSDERIKDLPHRAKLAISREIHRLRLIEKTLKGEGE